MNPIAIIQFPGSNTERETTMACNRVDMKSEELLLEYKIWRKDSGQ